MGRIDVKPEAPRGEVAILWLSKSFAVTRGRMAVLSGFDLHVRPGEALAVVGPLGCARPRSCASSQGSRRPTWARS